MAHRPGHPIVRTLPPAKEIDMTKAATPSSPSRTSPPPSPLRPTVAGGARAGSLAGRDLLSVTSLSRDEVLAVFETASLVKADIRPFRTALDGQGVILLFEKASLRTRVTFELGVQKLGGSVVYIDHSAQRLGERESIVDYGKNLERWVQCIVARVYSQSVVEELAAAAASPVINALSDMHHPCQALADLFTLREQFSRASKGFGGLKVAYLGDGNNVCNSLVQACAMLGADITAISPGGYEPARGVIAEAETLARHSGSRVTVTNDPGAVAGAHAVYTDVWVSMGQGAGSADEAAKRRKAFAPYQVTPTLMARAGADAKFMHCLPAHRGEEVLDAVIDSPNSIVYDQAENRLHVQNALLVHILGQT